MKDSKLIYALSHLDVYELNRFKKFVHSPYFNSNEKVSVLFEALEKYLKKDVKPPSKEKLFVKIYGNETYNDNRFRKLSTDLLALFEDFLANEKFQNGRLSKINALLSNLSERRIDKLYNSILSRSKRYTEQSFSKTSKFYYEQFSLQKNIFTLTSEFERKAKSKKELSDFNIPEISYNLDLFYIIEKLRYMCTVLSWQSVRSQKVEINFIDEIIKIIENSALLRNRVVQIYYLIYKTHVEEDNEEHFFKLKGLINQYLHIFTSFEAKEIFEATFTYCVKKANQGNNKYQSEVLSLYKVALETDILLIEGFISPTTFRNITMSALRLKEFKWVEDFLEKYQHNLSPKFATSVLSLNQALLSFYKKDFSKVIEHLVSFEYDEAHYALGAKSLLLATYYELDETEALFSFLDSFRIYVDRNKKIIERNKNSYRNLISYTRKLSKLNKPEQEKLRSLKVEIKKSNPVASKQWLLEKIAELEG